MGILTILIGFLVWHRSCKEDTKANAYFTMVRSNLEYCSAVWNPHNKDQVQKVEVVQRRAARFTTNRYRNTSSVSSMLDHLQWESLESRRSKIQLTLFYKVAYDLVDIPSSAYLTPSIARTRSSLLRSSDGSLLPQITLNQVSSPGQYLCGILFQLL